MSMVTAAWSLASAETLTRGQLLKKLLRETNIGMTSTVASGSTSTIVDTRLQSAQYSPDDNASAWARISYDAGGAAAAPEGEIRPVNADGYAPGNGKLTVSPPFTAAPAAGDIYQLWRSIHPQDVLDHIDEALVSDCWLPCWGILTDCPDGDMEQSNTTDWPATNATVTKVSTEPAMAGKRWLSVVTTSAGGYAQSATLKVIPGKSYHLSALVLVAAAGTTAQLIAFDNTNSTAIKTVASTSQNIVRLWMEFTAPATCDQVVIRLANAENLKTSKWDEVCFYGLQAYDVGVPWWVVNPTQVKGIFQLRMESLGTDIYDATMRGEPDDRWDIQPDTAFGRNQMRFTARQGYMTQPLFIFGTRNETAYADENTDVKHVEPDWLVAVVALKVFEQLQAWSGSGSLNMKWVDAQVTRWAREAEDQKRKQEARLSQVKRSTAPERYMYRRDSSANTAWLVR